ncbi:MAG: nucleotide exchange factor GrpE [Bdellovibrionales bacterium GWA2_49_15]|nr:MAG: nucleotide exchange factor GrpE [Bdellovibrionales bacterium GWA2_49_15]HAZ12790.1 nucleotide exchange factor GrpE [Bdellovibrionales bacterium]
MGPQTNEDVDVKNENKNKGSCCGGSEVPHPSQESKENVKEELAEVKEIKKEEIDYKSKYFYIAAEMDNMRKRFDREREGIVKYGTDKLLSALVPVLDNFDRTIEAVANDEDVKVKNLRKGIEMIRQQFVQVLEDNGLKSVSSIGKKFDPNFHEALTQEESDAHEEGTILREYEKAYVLNGRLLRAAKVVIAKKK